MKQKIIDSFKLKEDDVLHIFSYGSRVYGTSHDQSDYDFIVICKIGTMENDYALVEGDLSIHLYQEDLFLKHIQQHKLYAMECLFLSEKFVHLNKNPLPFTLNLSKLRSSFSEKASHSWVKAKKKLEVEKDRNVYIAKKSLFHSLRIIDFGIQIATQGSIVDYSSSNHLWFEIKDNPAEDWQTYKDKYQELFNNRMTQFRLVAPKE